MPIQRIAPELDRIVPPGAEPEHLGDGFGGERGPAEGPLWWSEGGYLLFSDIGNDRRMKWSPTDGVTLFAQPTNRTNGLTRDLKGRLIACEHDSRRVTRIETDGEITVVTNDYRGGRLNRPNDVVVKSDGSIYFTDPGISPESDLDFAGVYRVSPDLGTINALVRDFVVPNGLAFSPDERTLYINDSRRRHIRAFDVQDNGMPALASDRVFCEFHGEAVGVPDGMKVDIEGNVYCTGPGGIWIIASSGRHLGTISTPEQATNVAWGDEDWKTLYFTTWRSLGRIRLAIAGCAVPARP